MIALKIYKTVKQENGTITIYGSNRPITIDYDKTPGWSDILLILSDIATADITLTNL